MNKEFRIPPKSPLLLTTPYDLLTRLSCLIGKNYQLTNKTRTDGSNIRKLIASTLEQYPLPDMAAPNEYEIVPPKGKGVPKISREFIDTYIVTTGASYNLQVWNRIPASNSLLVKYESGESLKCTDVRFIFVQIDVVKQVIASIIILTPEYIENRFGRFGKPTIKYQLNISRKVRESIYASPDKILWFSDTQKLSYYITHEYTPPKTGIVSEPKMYGGLFSIELLRKLAAEKLIGQKLDAAATKNRGQALERKIAELLGYEIPADSLLHGAYPDIKNQLLEVKVQDSPTVDLGRFSPEREELIFPDMNLTTFDVRYLIALTNPETAIIEGVILSPGEKLGEVFSYISGESYKCQRSIPMSFFAKYYGKAVFNPD